MRYGFRGRQLLIHAEFSGHGKKLVILFGFTHRKNIFAKESINKIPCTVVESHRNLAHHVVEGISV